MEHPIENNVSECRNVFVSDSSEIGKNFMQLWLRVICEKEDGVAIKKNRQTVSL